MELRKMWFGTISHPLSTAVLILVSGNIKKEQSASRRWYTGSKWFLLNPYSLID